MAFVSPSTVLSPRNRVSHVEVIYDGGPDSWSVASLQWDGEDVVGIRWNGSDGSGVGSPQSRGLPTWFIVAGEIQDLVLRAARELARGGEARLSAA